MSLKNQAVSGVKWNSMSTLGGAGIQFIQMIALARILTPSEIGIGGIVLLVIGFSQIFQDIGISAAIIHHQDIKKDELSSLYWLNIFSGIILFFALFISANLISLLFDVPKLSFLMRYAAFLFLIIPFGQQFQIFLQKELLFRVLSQIEIISILVGVIISIVSAYYFRNARAFVDGQIVTSSIRVILLVIVGLKLNKPTLHFSFREVRKYISFGLYQMGEKIITYFNARVDQIIIATLMGTTQLGIYNIAYQLVMAPISKINPAINRVMFPVYAKMQHEPEKLRNSYLKALKLISLINFPILLGLASVAPYFTYIFYGTKWSDCIIIIQILSLNGLIVAMDNPIGAILLAKGRADMGFKWNLLVFLIQPLILFFAGHFGLIVLTSARTAVYFMLFILGYFLLLKPLVGGCGNIFFKKIFVNSLTYSLVMSGLVIVICKLINVSNLVSLIVGILTGVFIYSAVILYFEKDFYKSMINLFRNKNIN